MGSEFSKIKTDIPHSEKVRKFKWRKVPWNTIETQLLKFQPEIKSSADVVKTSWQEGVLYRVPSYMYHKRKWVKMVDVEKVNISEVAENLKFMTYNVWFEDHFVEQRYSVIMKMIKDSDADFICLQEVTQ